MFRVAAVAALLALAFPTPSAAAPARVSLPVAAAVDALPSAAEVRDGYDRTKFRHWVDADRDGCSTRAEVLLAESLTEPVVDAGCRVVAGEWFSYYDGVTVVAPGGLDIDHMVPLAEAWDSGASAWSAGRREAYANDLDAERSLVAVTARTNRSKADQDPAEWLPPAAGAYCTYLVDWVATKLRWQLTVDEAEREALGALAGQCDGQTVEYEPAP
ncbi:HNH endonuclease family protein [Streptomyces sp. CSMPJR101]|uniref:HNH endonuclease family protein n=1 Tax=Streptomyces sp. CSMPJR101 TaxID=1279378 RepID=UPI003853A009